MQKYKCRESCGCRRVLRQAPGGKRNLATKAVEVALSKAALFLAEQHALPVGDQYQLHNKNLLAS